jgi:GPH family glycoside/pentoside/hexuronide:cation symporter
VAALGAPAFRRLLAVFMLNGIASAIPATLVLFFIQDRLQAPPAQEPCSWRLFRLRRTVHPAVAARRGPLWPGAHLAGRHAAGDGGVCVDGAFWAAGDALPFLVVCALSRAWRWAPTWPCPAPCWPA